MVNIKSLIQYLFILTMMSLLVGFQTVNWALTISGWTFVLSFAYIIDQNNKYLNAFILNSLVTMSYLVLMTFSYSFDFTHFPSMLVAYHILLSNRKVDWRLFYVFVPLLFFWANTPIYFHSNSLLTICYFSNTALISIILAFKKFLFGFQYFGKKPVT
jgi:hypothetical protein